MTEPLVSFPTQIDNTLRNTFVSCPRKFFYMGAEHLKPVRKSIHLHAGGVFAKGLEIYRKSYYVHKLPEDQCLVKGFTAMIKMWGDEDPEELDPNKTLWNMLLALEYYFEQWPVATDFVQPHYINGEPMIECTFAIPIPGVEHPITGEPIMYCGRYDLLANFNGQIFVDDEKTTKQLGGWWPSQWELNSQITGYVWAAQQYGLPVAGGLIRGIGILLREFKSTMAIEYRSQWEIDRWLHQLQRDVKRMIQCWREGYWDYSLGDACSAYGGCGYKKLCQGENYKDWIEGNYKVEIWNPLSKDSD